MSDEKNGERRRKTDTFWGQIKSTISAHLMMTVAAGVLLFFSGYQGMKMKISSLEASNTEQKEDIRRLSQDNSNLTKLVIELKVTIDNLSDKVLDIKADQSEIKTDVREMRSEISAIRRGR